MREFVDTSDIPVPKTLIEQVLGQEEACTIIRQAARQRRHVLLVGDPGTGKSMLGQAMAELIEITNPEDILVVPHPLEPALPHIRRVPAGQGVQEVDRHRSRAQRATQSLRFVVWIVVVSLLLVSLYFSMREASATYLLGGAVLVGLTLWLRQQ